MSTGELFLTLRRAICRHSFAGLSRRADRTSCLSFPRTEGLPVQGVLGLKAGQSQTNLGGGSPSPSLLGAG